MPPIMEIESATTKKDKAFFYSAVQQILISQVLPKSRSIHLCVHAVVGPSLVKNVPASTDAFLSTTNAPQWSSQGQCLGIHKEIHGDGS